MQAITQINCCISIVRKQLNDMVRDKLAGATAMLVDATPRIADELISLAMDSRINPYSRVNAMALVFENVAKHLIEGAGGKVSGSVSKKTDYLVAGKLHSQ